MKTFNQIIRDIFLHPIVKYYCTHPLVLLKNRKIFFSLWWKRISGKDINFKAKNKSNLPIDIVLTAIEKDYEVLEHVLDSIRKYINHPVGKIIVIAPKSSRILDLCKQKECQYVDENTVLPITKKDITYSVRNIDRRGWLLQQLLKYAAEKYCSNAHYLVTEADTIFLRPRIFEQNGKALLPCCNQLCHIPYFDSYKKLLGVEALPLVNLTSHHTLISKIRMAELKAAIEKNCKKPWYMAMIEDIDKTDGSAISDYETYGQFVLNNYPGEVALEDWSNISLGRSLFPRVKELQNSLAPKYKTVSFQSYNK